MDEDEGGARYAYLLQPIKDLDKNFSVDIVSLLDKYRTQLAELAQDEEFRKENAHRFNFAEAAMLIQGSVSVYGKKVDHVYTQAMNFFDSIQVAKGKKKKNVDSAEDDEGFGGGDDDENVDPLGMTPIDPCQLQDMSRCKPANVSSLVMKYKTADVPSISIMPMSLMPLADFEKCNVPIYNSKNKNEVVGKKDDYKINTGYMCDQGALLLDLLNERLLNKFTDETICTQESQNEINDDDSGRGSPVGADGSAGMTDVDVPLTVENGGEPRVSHVVEVNRRATDGMTFDGLQPRPSTVLLQAAPVCSQPILEMVESTIGGGADDDDDFIGDLPAPKNLPALKKLELWQAPIDNVEIDPTAALIEDPYEEVNWKHKPLNHKVNCSINVHALLNKKRKELMNMGPREKTMETIEYVNENFYYKGKRQRRKKEIGLSWESNWDTDALFPYILEQQKRREKQKREEQAKKKKERISAAKPGQPRFDDDDDDDFGGGFEDDDIDQAAPALPNQSRHFADINDEEMNISINIPSLYIGAQPGAEDPIDDVGPIGDIERPHSSMSLHELLEFYMKKYWNAAAEATSRLAARVQEWDERMQPLLEEEETRKEFDIHEYGGELLELFQNEQEQKELPELLAGKKDYEISRYFLSCLMMANTLNVEIVNEQQTGPDPMKMMSVKLLKRDRHHEVFDQAGAL